MVPDRALAGGSLRPVFPEEIVDAGKLTAVRGDQGEAARERLAGEKRIVRADRLFLRFEAGTDTTCGFSVAGGEV